MAEEIWIYEVPSKRWLMAVIAGDAQNIKIFHIRTEQFVYASPDEENVVWKAICFVRNVDISWDQTRGIQKCFGGTSSSTNFVLGV